MRPETEKVTFFKQILQMLHFKKIPVFALNIEILTFKNLQRSSRYL